MENEMFWAAFAVVSVITCWVSLLAWANFEDWETKYEPSRN